MQILLYSEKKRQDYVLVPICTNYTLIKNGFDTRDHIHPVYHLVFMVQGHGYLESDESKYSLKEKDIFIVNPNKKHIYSSDKNADMLHYTINFYLIPLEKFQRLDPENLRKGQFDDSEIESLAEISKLDDILDFKVKNNIFIAYEQTKWSLILTLADTFCSLIEKKVQNPFYIMGPEVKLKHMSFSDYYSKFVLDFFYLFTGFEENNESSFDKKDEALLNRIVDYLNENLQDKFNLCCLARHLNYSPVYISSYFRNKTGMTLTQYLNKLKINKACAYLRRTDKTIYEIASNLNFSSANHFSNNFKKEKCISPKEYRRHPELQ